MKRILCLTLIALSISCSWIKQRVAIKECKFALQKVTPYDFSLTDLKLDFDIKGDNPNKVDAVLDKLTYTFYVNESSVFSGTTGKGIKIQAGKSKTFSTTISLNYKDISDAILNALKAKKASYKLKGRAYIETIIGEISYPVEIKI